MTLMYETHLTIELGDTTLVHLLEANKPMPSSRFTGLFTVIIFRKSSILGLTRIVH